MSTETQTTPAPRRRGRPPTKANPPAPVVITSELASADAPSVEVHATTSFPSASFASAPFSPGSFSAASFSPASLSAVLPAYEEALKFGQDNAKALAESSTLLVDAVRSLTEEVASFTKSSLEESIAEGKAFLHARTVRELFEMSHSFAKASLDKLVDESTRLTKLSTKLTGEAIAPLKDRLDATVSHISEKLH